MANKRRDNAIERARRGREDVKKMAGNPQSAEGAESAPASEEASSALKKPKTSSQGDEVAAFGPTATGANSDAAPPRAGEAEQKDSGDSKTPDESTNENREAAMPAEKVHNGPADTTEVPVIVGSDEVVVVSLDDVLIGGINTRVVDRESAKFKELVASIRDDGQLSPLLVGREGDKYRLIAGERRYWAMRTVGLATAKVVVTNAPREKWDDLNLVENLMREDLSVWEEALGYRKLMNSGASQEEVAQRVHKSEAHVSLVLKVSRIPQLVAALEEGILSSDSMAMEVARLIDANGDEIVPGSVQRALDYISNSKHPVTIRELRAYVMLLRERLEPEKTKPTRRTVRRSSFLRTEQTRLEAIVAMVPDLSVDEVTILGDTYEQMGRTLKALATQGNNGKETVASDN